MTFNKRSLIVTAKCVCENNMHRQEQKSIRLISIHGAYAHGLASGCYRLKKIHTK